MADCPAVPEMVVMGVGHGRIETAIEDVLSVEGVKAIVTPGLGNEAGHDGPPISERISARVREAGIAMVGPNCMGIATPGSPSPWIGSLHPDIRAAARSRRSPTRARSARSSSRSGRGSASAPMVSAGNETVADAADFVAWFADDPATRVIGLFLEAVRRPEAFEEALRRVAEAGKVAIVLKVGTSEIGAEAALAHTGALVGSDRSFSAMLRHYDAIRVDDFGDWLEHLEVFGRERPPRGRRIGVVTNSGGEGEYFADKAEQAGIPLSLFSDELRARDHRRVPELPPRRQPGRLLGDRRRPGRLPACVPDACRVGRVRRPHLGDRPFGSGCGAPSGTWRRTSPRICGTPWTARTSSRR